MGTHDTVRGYGGLSLVSVMLTAVAITINHLYTLGTGAFVLGFLLLVVPAALWWWFRRTQSRLAFVGYLLMNAWIVVGFGLAKGFWDGVLRLFLGTFLASRSSAFPKPAIGSAGFELSGLLMFVGSVFVLYFAYKFIQTMRASDTSAAHVRRSDAIFATSVVATLMAVTSTWAVIDGLRQRMASSKSA